MHTVAFLMLDDIHHVHHLAPIALELSKNNHFQCTVFLQEHSLFIFKNIATLYPTQRCQIIILKPSPLKQLRHYFNQKIGSSACVINYHWKKFLHYDAIISPDLDTHQLIKRSQKMQKKPLFFYFPHGAGDHNMGNFERVKKVDRVLLPGNKYKKFFISAGYVNPKDCAVIGYPKFDIIPAERKPRLFHDERPIILYNPHSSLDNASWQPWGIDILEYLYHQSRYNIIFAPHRNLFARALNAQILPKKYFNAPHFLIDLGSEQSVDMTYTQAADIYLGDISSQVYEFIRQPRPCIFLNAHQMNWQDDPHYRYWHLGTVVDHLPALWKIFNTEKLLNPFLNVQKTLFNDTFSIDPQLSAASRGTQAIQQAFNDIIRA